MDGNKNLSIVSETTNGVLFGSENLASPNLKVKRKVVKHGMPSPTSSPIPFGDAVAAGTGGGSEEAEDWLKTK